VFGEIKFIYIDSAKTLIELSPEDMKHNTTYKKYISVKKRTKIAPTWDEKQAVRHDVERQYLA